jgi:hypothetical protein
MKNQEQQDTDPVIHLSHLKVVLQSITTMNEQTMKALNEQMLKTVITLNETTNALLLKKMLELNEQTMQAIAHLAQIVNALQENMNRSAPDIIVDADKEEKQN